MAVSLILPASAIDDDQLTFLVNRVQEYFASPSLYVYAAGALATRAPATAGVGEILPIARLAAGTGDTLAFVKEADGSAQRFERGGPPAWQEFDVERSGRIFSRKRSISVVECPDLETHVFNRLGPREPGNLFYYYPYGYLFRDISVGPVDSLGFRIPTDLDFLKQRPAHHKLVVVFGGSAAFSMYSSRSEMFSTVLERNLNALAEGIDGDLSVTVLNFGMHGHVLLNEILSFLLYCHEIKPNMVIAHDGWNDFTYGLMSDPHLLDKWAITYQYNLESWSQLLHATYDHPVGQPTVPFEAKNLPFSVLRAYLNRKRQFEELAKGFGANFVWGLQPTIYDKGGQSQIERERCNLESQGMHAFGKIYPKVKILCDFFTAGVRAGASRNFVDLPRYFSEFDDTVTLFADHVHTAPEGDRVIADIYARLLAPVLSGQSQTIEEHLQESRV
jgi:hypothetical protein